MSTTSARLFVLLVVPAVLLAGCTHKNAPPTSGVACVDMVDAVGEAETYTPSPDHRVVELTTSKGSMKVELLDTKAPVTTENFVTYVNEGFYDGVLFHRIIRDFMVQTGGMGTDGQWKQTTHSAITNEGLSSGCKNLPYTLAMARTSDPNSATSQFFINTNNNSFLDPSSTQAGYAVFGVVFEGRATVDAIEATPVEPYAQGKKCQADSQPSCPREDVVLQSARVV